MKLSQLLPRGRGTAITFGLGAALLCSAGSLRSQGEATKSEAASSDWPRSYSVDDDEVIIYQPKVEKWDQKYVEARFAVGIKGKDDEQPIYGTFLARGQTLANLETHTISVFNITEDEFKFPDAGKRLDHFMRDLAAVAPDQPIAVPMDQLVASVSSEDAVTQDTVMTDTDSNAPRVVVSYTPTLLVAFDGQPIYRPIPDVKLENAVNTAATVLRPQGKPSPLYLLTNEGQWLTADSLEGPWETSHAPDGIKKIPTNHPVAVAIKNAGTPSGDADAPNILTAENPTELIQINGKPSYKQIGDSSLLRVGNSDTPLFYHFERGSYFVLISGRWFTTKDLKGPWNYTAQNQLPQDFAQIPLDDPSAEVRASVAGTPEAHEAVVEAQVPVKAQVSLQDPPDLEVKFEGEPKFEEIDGTECSYAVNTTSEVLCVNGRYYCCYDGVWFMADRPLGTWRLATVLPRAILGLPPSCPLYHLRFCVIDGLSDDLVTYSCTGGYWGTYIDPDSEVCVYGTGFYYPPYVSGGCYVGYPWSYGFGCHWWKHNGFVYEGRHVAHTTWSPRLNRDDHQVAVWRSGSERWGGHMDNGTWEPVKNSSAPFHFWGDKVTSHHPKIIAAATKDHAPAHKDSPKPHVVFHGKGTTQKLVTFEPNLHVGAQGEIIRHNGKVFERREVGQGVAHANEGKVEKHTPAVTHAETDEPKKKAPQVTRAVEVRRGDIVLDRMGGKIMVMREDVEPSERKPEHFEHKIIKSDGVVRAQPIIIKGDTPPKEHIIIRGNEVSVTKQVSGSDGTPHERARSVSRSDATPSGTVQSRTTIIQTQPSFQPRVEHHESSGGGGNSVSSSGSTRVSSGSGNSGGGGGSGGGSSSSSGSVRTNAISGSSSGSSHSSSSGSSGSSGRGSGGGGSSSSGSSNSRSNNNSNDNNKNGR